MTPPLSQTIRWFTCISIALVSVIGVLCIMAGNWVKVDRIEQEGKVLATTATALGKRIDRILFERYGDMRVLAAMKKLDDTNVTRITKVLQGVQYAYGNAYDALGVTDRDGRVIASTNASFIGIDLSDRPLFIAIQQQGEIYMDDARARDWSPDTLSILFGAPLMLQDGNVQTVGMVFASIPLKYLIAEFEREIDVRQQHTRHTSKIEWQLLRHDGVVLADSNVGEHRTVTHGQLNHSSVEAVSLGYSGFLVERHEQRDADVITGYSQLTGFAEFQGFKWGILLRQDVEAVVASARTLRKILLWLGLSFLLPHFGLLLWARRQFHKADKNDQEVKQAVQRMADESRAIVEASPVAMLVVTSGGRIELMNHITEQIYQYSQEELVGNTIAMLIPERYWTANSCPESLIEQWLLDVSPESPMELYGCRKDGSEFPIEIRINRLEHRERHYLSGETHREKVLMSILDITERKHGERVQEHQLSHLEELVRHRTADLQHAKEAAEQANSSQSVFLANISHELRTPMHAILSFASLGIDRFDRATPEKIQSYLRQIKESGNRLLLLVNDLLDLSKLEAGKMPLTFQPCHINALLRSMETQIAPLLQAKEIQLVVAEEHEVICVCADADRITQVLWNLMSNAVKFSPPGSHVRVSWQATSVRQGRRTSDLSTIPGVQVTIWDAGPGIPEHELSTIFEKFVQSSMTRTGAGGTGLGLSICREIIHGHGGNIWAENHPDHGAMFHFTLPLNPRQMAQSESGESSIVKSTHAAENTFPTTSDIS
ncbi:ATP-binding protein [Nitrospira sp. M1]